jgi:hypothetical protein
MGLVVRGEESDMTINEACKKIYPWINPETIRVWITRGIFNPRVIQRRPTREGSELDEADLVVIGLLNAFHRCGGRFKTRQGEGVIFIEPPIDFSLSALRKEDLPYFNRQKVRGRDVQAYLELLQFRVFMSINGSLTSKYTAAWMMRFEPLEQVHTMAAKVVNSEATETLTIINCFKIWRHVQSRILEKG